MFGKISFEKFCEGVRLHDQAKMTPEYITKQAHKVMAYMEKLGVTPRESLPVLAQAYAIIKELTDLDNKGLKEVYDQLK
jgi:hypothetical protein